MDTMLNGHGYAKSAIDMACWDLLGKVCGKSVCDLLGGRFGESITLYRAISQRPADEMAENVARYRAEGYTRFQLKVGGDPLDDIERIAELVLAHDGIVISDEIHADLIYAPHRHLPIALVSPEIATRTV